MTSPISRIVDEAADRAKVAVAALFLGVALGLSACGQNDDMDAVCFPPPDHTNSDRVLYANSSLKKVNKLLKTHEITYNVFKYYQYTVRENFLVSTAE